MLGRVVVHRLEMLARSLVARIRGDDRGFVEIRQAVGRNDQLELDLGRVSCNIEGRRSFRRTSFISEQVALNGRRVVRECGSRRITSSGNDEDAGFFPVLGDRMSVGFRKPLYCVEGSLDRARFGHAQFMTVR